MTTIGMRALAVPRGPEERSFIRDPQSGRFLPQEGVEVVVDVFWVRREREGAVELRPIASEEPAPAESVPSEAAPEAAPETDAPETSGGTDDLNPPRKRTRN